jgi:hypothetical protein
MYIRELDDYLYRLVSIVIDLLLCTPDSCLVR